MCSRIETKKRIRKQFRGNGCCNEKLLNDSNCDEKACVWIIHIKMFDREFPDRWSWMMLMMLTMMMMMMFDLLLFQHYNFQVFKYTESRDGDRRLKILSNKNTNEVMEVPNHSSFQRLCSAWIEGDQFDNLP